MHDLAVPAKGGILAGRLGWRLGLEVAAEEGKRRVNHQDDLANTVYKSDRIKKVGVSASNVHPQIPEDGRQQGRVHKQVRHQERVPHIYHLRNTLALVSSSRLWFSPCT